MSRQSTTIEKVVCDGCGREAGSKSEAARWRVAELRIARLDGEHLRDGSVDLCPTCLGAAHVPGLDPRSPL
jgi:hypothetical protein